MSDIQAYGFELAKSINTDTPALDIKPIGQPAPHIRNNGIERDGGVTNVYETAADESASYDFVFHASNGKRVQIKNQGASGNGIWVDDEQVQDHGAKSVWLLNELNVTVPGYTIVDVTPGLDRVWALGYTPAGDLYRIEVALDGTPSNETLVVSGLPYDLDKAALCKTMRAAADTTNRTPDYVAYMTESAGTFYPTIKKISTGGVMRFTTLGGLSYGYFFTLFESNTTAGNVLAILNNVSNQGFVNYALGRAFAVGDFAPTYTGGGVTVPISALHYSDDEVMLSFAPTAAGPNVGVMQKVSLTALTSTDITTAATSGGYAIPGAVAVLGSGAGGRWGDYNTGYLSFQTGQTYPPLVDTNLPTVKVYDFTAYAVGEKYSHFSIHQAGLSCEIGAVDSYLGVFQSRERTDWNTPQVYAYRRFDGGYTVLYGKDNYSSVKEIAPGKVKIGPFFVDSDNLTCFFCDEGFNGNNPNITAGSTLYAVKQQAEEFGSVDTGASVGNLPPGSINYFFMAWFQTDGFYQIEPIKVYVAGDYVYSVIAPEFDGVNPNPIYTFLELNEAGAVYVENSRLPIAGPTPVSLFSVDLPQGTALRAENYNGYEIGNILAGEYDLFLLFGQFYAFDGNYIWLVPTSAGIVQGALQRVAPAQGLRYLTSGPEAAYFLTDYDNGLFVFNGGRSLQKIARMNQKAAVKNGIYNVEENALHMITENSLLILRDNISTENERPFDNGDVALYSTANGIIYGQGAEWKSLQFRSNVFSAGTTAVVPLDFQGPFYGPGSNEYYQTPYYYVQLYRPAGPGTMTVDFIYSYIDADIQGTETKSVNLVAADFTSAGYCRVRYIPTKDSVMGNSLRIQCEDKIVILEVTQYYGNRGAVSVPTARTAQ